MRSARDETPKKVVPLFPIPEPPPLPQPSPKSSPVPNSNDSGLSVVSGTGTDTGEGAVDATTLLREVHREKRGAEPLPTVTWEDA